MASTVALLVAFGIAPREDAGNNLYPRIVGGGFIFTYRLADPLYGFAAELQKPVRPFWQIIDTVVPQSLMTIGPSYQQDLALPSDGQAPRRA